jgi:hypothetical protein
MAASLVPPLRGPDHPPRWQNVIKLRDAGHHVTSLPKAEQDLNVAAVDRSLMGAADGRDFVMHSRIGVLHALNRNVKGLFNSGHKDTLEKARDIKTVQGISESWDESEGK